MAAYKDTDANYWNLQNVFNGQKSKIEALQKINAKTIKALTLIKDDSATDTFTGSYIELVLEAVNRIAEDANL